jgi:tungstate transport system permease protein
MSNNSPTVMIIAQVVLILPIVCCLTFQITESLHVRYHEFFSSYRIRKLKSVIAYIVDSRFELTTVVLAGIGRSISEVGAIIIVGGNIDHITRVMTTAIALETSKGNLDLALGLGIILLVTAIILNGVILFLRRKYHKVPGSTI